MAEDEKKINLRYKIRLEYNRLKLTVFDTLNPSQEYALIDPNLHLETDNAGSFEATFPLTNVVMSKLGRTPWFTKYVTRVVIYYTKDQHNFKILWRGRLLSADEDFYGQVHTYFEGDLSTLNDTVMEPVVFHYDQNSASTGVKIQANYNLYYFSGNTYPIIHIMNVHNVHLMMKNLSNHRQTEEEKRKYDALQDQRMWFIPLPDPLDASYECLATEPEDWATTYTSYYTQTKTKYQTIYNQVPQQAFVPTFKVNTYYRRRMSDRTKGIPDDIFSQNDLVIENETVFSAMQKIVDNYGGHFRVLYDTYYEGDPEDGGILYGKDVERSRLQWVEMPKEYDSDTPVTQYIAFGENLIEFTKKTEIKDLVTCIRPRGKKIHSAGATALGVNYRVASMPTVPDEHDQNFRLVYTRLVTEPSDWKTNFWSYFEKRRDVYCPLFKSYKAPDFSSGEYYSATLDGTAGIVGRANQGYIIYNTFGTVLDVYIYQNNSTSNTLECDKFDYKDGPYYITTGYWASSNGKTWGHQPPYDNTFVAYPGEKYYILATGNYDANARVTACIITDGCFRNLTDNAGNKTWYFTPVSNTQFTQASMDRDHMDYEHDDLSGRSGLIYKLVTMPEYKWGNGLHVNLSSRITTGTPNNNPTLYKDLHMDIWGTRIVDLNEDEYITLCGLGDGTWPAYMGTVSNDTEANKRKMQNSIDNKTENIPIFVEPITVDGTNFDGYFLYPYPNGSDPEDQSQVIGYYESNSDFPSPSSQNVGKYIANITTGNVYRCDANPGGYEYVEIVGERLFYKEADGIYDVKLVKEYGIVESIVGYNDVEDPKKLRTLACETLYNAVFEKMSLSVTALDLALLDNSIDVPRIMDPIHIVSPYHKVDMLLPLQSMDIPFNKLEDQTFNIGYEKEQKITDRQKIQNIKKG